MIVLLIIVFTVNSGRIDTTTAISANQFLVRTAKSIRRILLLGPGCPSYIDLRPLLLPWLYRKKQLINPAANHSGEKHRCERGISLVIALRFTSHQILCFLRASCWLSDAETENAAWWACQRTHGTQYSARIRYDHHPRLTSRFHLLASSINKSNKSSTKYHETKTQPLRLMRSRCLIDNFVGTDKRWPRILSCKM